MRHAVGRLWCVVVGHRGVKVITAVKPISASFLGGLGFEVAGHRWDCSRCGSRGVRLAG